MAEHPARSRQAPSARVRPLTDWAQLRLAANLSLSQAAARSGVNGAYISMIETGRMVPSAAEARRILAASGVAAAVD